MEFCEKLLKKFVVLYLKELSHKTLENIYFAIVSGFLGQAINLNDIDKVSAILVKMTLNVLIKI